jgi:hypothetical protein
VRDGTRLTDRDHEDVLRGYVECAMWSSTYEDSEGETLPMDDGTYTSSDFAPETVATFRADCARFVSENESDCVAYLRTRRVRGVTTVTADYIGHDLWLTRNGHGAGFWDRGLGELGDRLTTAAHALGECSLVIGDDGKVYAE